MTRRTGHRAVVKIAIQSIDFTTENLNKIDVKNRRLQMLSGAIWCSLIKQL